MDLLYKPIYVTDTPYNAVTVGDDQNLIVILGVSRRTSRYLDSDPRDLK